MANGRTPVYVSPTLTAAAVEHARWLRDQDRFQHDGDGGSSPLDRATAASYPGTVVGENLARGPRAASGAFVAWRMSAGHDAMMLDSRWNAVGVAKVDTTAGTLWVTVFGNVLDCPPEPPDFDTTTDPPDPIVIPVGTPPTEVLSDAAANAPVVTPVLDVTATSAVDTEPASVDAGPTPVANAVDVVPVIAVTVSDLSPSTGDRVTITNRSTGVAQIAAGDGGPAVPIAAGGSRPVTYLVPGTFDVAATIDQLTTGLPLDVTGEPRAPAITYTGPSTAAFGQRVAPSATLTAGGVPVPGRTVTFTLADRTWSAVTGADGTATTDASMDLPPAARALQVAAPALGGSPAATTSAAFSITANGRPVVDTGGPYEVLMGDVLPLDPTGSFDPDGGPILPPRWDLDEDGQFDDFVGDGDVGTIQLDEVVCGGTCDPAVVETISVRVVDLAGSETIASTTVTFRRDFRVGVTPPTAVVNPGGSVSFNVQVTSTSGFVAPVTLSVPDLPTGVNASFSPPSVVPGSTSLLTLSATAGVPATDVPFTVRGTSGSIVHDAVGSIDVEFGLVPDCTGALDVHIFDAETGEPIPGVWVSNVQTDADGRLSIEDIPLGQGNAPRTYFLSIMAEGYNQATSYALRRLHGANVGRGPAPEARDRGSGRSRRCRHPRPHQHGTRPGGHPDEHPDPGRPCGVHRLRRW